MKHFMPVALLSLGIAILAFSQPALAARQKHHPHAAGPRLHVTHPRHVHHVRRTHHRVSARRADDRAHLLRARLAPARIPGRLSLRLSPPPPIASIALPLPRRSELLPRALKTTTRPALVTLASIPMPVRTIAMPIARAEATEPTNRPQYHREPAAQKPNPITEASDREASISETAASEEPASSDQDQPSPLRMIPALYNSTRTAAAEDSDNGEAVTLIYKDGRPAEQIHNYLLSRTTLSIWDRDRDRRYRNIPVEQLDLEATQKANRELGVDFALPTPEQ